MGMSLFLAQLFPKDGAENGRTTDFVMQRYLMNFCIKIKTSKNTTQEMTTAIWRISAGLNIPLYPEFAKEQANEGRKPPKMNNICCSKDLITHVHINNERAVNNKNKVPEIQVCRLYFHILPLQRLVDSEKINSCMNFARITFSKSDT